MCIYAKLYSIRCSRQTIEYTYYMFILYFDIVV